MAASLGACPCAALSRAALAPRRCGARATAARPGALAVVAGALRPGAKVRVKEPVTIYHVGKFKEGLQLQGMEGSVVADVSKDKKSGKTLSATFEWKCAFAPPGPDGKPVKVQAHFVEDELEVLD